MSLAQIKRFDHKHYLDLKNINLKTYNYEDLIKGHSSVIEDANQQISEEGNFDRENPEFFDVPRRVSNDKAEPYIIYQLADKPSDDHAGGGGVVFSKGKQTHTQSLSQSTSQSLSPILSQSKLQYVVLAWRTGMLFLTCCFDMMYFLEKA